MQTEYRPHRQQKKGGLVKRAGAGLTSLAGITAAIATITTSTAAVLGVVVHSKNTQLQQAQAQVSSQAQQIQHQAKQIQQLQQTATTPTVSPSPTTGGAPITDASHYLSNKTATVDNADLGTGQVVISANPYVNSITFNCWGQQSGQPDEAFDVAGSSTFTAVLGIPDDTQNATGLIATITFGNESGQQIGQQFQVSLGHPANVTLDIKGVTQLGMTCDGRNRQTSQTASDFHVAFGNAAVS
jgi:cell division protein FtsL